MSLNTTESEEYTCVRFYVSTVSFSVLLFFNLIINWTIVREERLRGHARFVLVFHLLVSALVYLGMSSVFYYQIHLSARPGHTACMTMITVLISSAANILLTLTAMALDRFCAVCHPLRYSSICTAGYWPWVLGVVTWLLALVIPLSLLVKPDPEDHEECDRAQLKRGELQKVLFIGVCTLLILYSYVRILQESRRLGVLNRRNRAGCRTIALHGTQLAVYLLPNFVNFMLTILRKKDFIQQETKELAAVVIFAFFSVAQCIAPVVYGLRKEELLEQLNRRFPCCSRYLKTVLGWTVRASWPHTQPDGRERTLTVQTTISFEPPHEDDKETGPLSVNGFSHDQNSSQGITDKA
ncbi:odorant receptor 131-2 [Nematolebias whitei]|uniref:odorant receptor 131-2 n=1 Tax=Nematolebias whitei TaxID=451745 RepID=UPI00189A006A|nr:odorant receptor 131-2 [Nematolebias whitei]